MNRWIAICLVLLMVFGGTAALAQDEPHVDEDGATIENPIHEVATFEELLLAVPGVALANAPEDTTDVSYAWVHTEPLIAQIQFCYGDDHYTFRAAALESGAEAVDIDGLYLEFDLEESFDNLYANDLDLFRARSSSVEPYVAVDWVRADLGTQYSLFSETAGEPEMRIMDVVVLLLPIGANWPLETNE